MHYEVHILSKILRVFKNAVLLSTYKCLTPLNAQGFLGCSALYAGNLDGVVT